MDKKANIFKLIQEYIAWRRYKTEADYFYGRLYFISQDRQDIEKYVRNESFDPNQYDENGSPLLNEVVKDIRLLWLVRPILANPNLPEIVTDANGNNPYQMAIKYGNPMAADLLAPKFKLGADGLSREYATAFQCQNFEGKEFFYAYCFDHMRNGERIKVIKARLAHEGDPIYDKMYEGWLRNGYTFKHKPYAAVVDIKENEWRAWFMDPTDQLDADGDRITTNPYLFANDEYCKAKCHERELLSGIEEIHKELEELSKTWFNPDEYLGNKEWNIE